MITIPAHGESFLSRLLDDGDTKAVRQFNVERRDFGSQTEREVFDFIMEYAKSNRGATPDYRTVIEACPDFYYREGVTDSYRYMVDELKSWAAKKSTVDVLAEFEDVLNEKNGNVAIDYLISELETIKMRTSVRGQIGVNVKKDTEKILEEYEKRKAGESYRVWDSFLPKLNSVVGGYVSANVYVIYGKSGRGKSVIALREALGLAVQGAKVVVWSLEMGWYEVIVRLFTMYSAMVGDLATATIGGVDMDVGFNARDLKNGDLPEDFEEKFYEFVRSLNDKLEGELIIRGVDEEDFTDRSLKALESDILQTEADVVLIDPFYYLDYEANTSKKTGGDAENTSKKLRRLTGTTGVTVLAITQASEGKESEDDDGTRELSLPKRADVKKTTQLLEDAALLIAVDTNYLDGRGLVGLNKGRDGGEGEVAEIMYLPQYGIVKEIALDELQAMEIARQF